MTRGGKKNDVERLIVRLYEAAIDSRPLEELAEDVCRCIGAHALWSQLRRPSGEPLGAYALHGLTTEALEEYATHHWRSNPVTDPMLASPFDQVRDLHRVREPGALERSSMYQEWAIPNGLVHTFGWRGEVGSDRVLAVSVGYESRAELTRADRRVLERIAPHFTQSARLWQTLGEARAEARGLRSLVDSLRCAVILVDDDGAVVDANDAGATLLRDGSVLCHRDRRLVATDPGAARRLRAAWARVASSRVPAPVPLGPRAPTRPIAYVLPRRGALGVDEPGAVVLVPPAGAGDAALEDCLRITHGLTPAEARVTISLARGVDLRSIADRRGVALGTVRNQLKRAMAKLGVRRQQKLVAIVAAAAGPLDLFFE